MEQGHKVLFVLAGLAIIAALLGYRTFHAPAILVGPTDDPDAVRLGMSAVNHGTVSGPAYLQANKPLYFPAPMFWLNPGTSKATAGA